MNPKKAFSLQGGLHWVSMIVLPKRFQPRFKANLGNKNELIFFIDSLGQYTPPDTLKEIIRNGYKYTDPRRGNQEYDRGGDYERKLEVRSPFPSAEWFEIRARQQKGGNDCGWWALYNILMTLFEGSTGFISKYYSPSASAGEELRKIFGELHQMSSFVGMEPFNKNNDDYDPNLSQENQNSKLRELFSQSTAGNSSEEIDEMNSRSPEFFRSDENTKKLLLFFEESAREYDADIKPRRGKKRASRRHENGRERIWKQKSSKNLN